MIRTAVLGFALALGMAGAAQAAGVGSASVGSAPVAGLSHNGIITVGEGCGPNRWKGPGGNCNNFHGAEGTNRGTAEECPPGFHYEFHGAGTGRCYNNR